MSDAGVPEARRESGLGERDAGANAADSSAPQALRSTTTDAAPPDDDAASGAWTPGPFEEAMVDYVYKDPEFRQYICGEGPCPKQKFRDGLIFEREVLNPKLNLIALYVEPKRMGDNFFTGFFVLKDGKLLPEFIFFGTGIGSNNQGVDKLGTKIVHGRERRGGAVWEDYDYEWNGKEYVLVRETTVGKTLWDENGGED